MKEIKPSDLEQILNNQRITMFRRSMAKGLAENNLNWFDAKPILSSSFNRTLHHIHSGAPVMFISACTSRMKDDEGNYTETEEEHEIRNKRNTEKLINDVIDLELSFIKVNGHWVEYSPEIKKYRDFPEASLMVLGYDRYGDVLDFEEFKKIGIELRDKYMQWAVLLGRSLGDDELDFKYYNNDGSTLEFGTISVTNNKDVKKIVDKYNKETLSYIRRKEGSNKSKTLSKLEKKKSKTNGWTEYSSGRNISLSSTILVKKRPFFGDKEDNWFYYD